jgi:hypothetical protein
MPHAPIDFRWPFALRPGPSADDRDDAEPYEFQVRPLPRRSYPRVEIRPAIFVDPETPVVRDDGFAVDDLVR